MAEYIFAELLRRHGATDRFEVSSSAVSREEIGNDVYPPARRQLLSHGIPCPSRAARQITAGEIGEYDHILCMDRSNLERLARISLAACEKAKLLGDYGEGGAEIEDPWYTGRFDRVFEEIYRCCESFLDSVL